MNADIDWEHAADDLRPALLARSLGPLEPAFNLGAIPMPDLASLALKWTPHAIAGFNSVIFLDSLRYKFTDHPKTQEIFSRLDSWAASWGAPGLFGHTGIFSQYVIGTAELVASTLLLVGLFLPAYRFLQPMGALLGLAIMTGAISFHLFTPLGVDPNNDGGGLFIAACLVWIGSAALVAFRWQETLDLVRKGAAFAAPAM